MKFKTFKFKKVTSTNDLAIKLIIRKKKISGLVIAKQQTKGRGTHGKTWVSDVGNFFGSIFFPLKETYPSFNEFAIINPVIISKVIKHFVKKNIINLKFPNDLLLNKKKVCGILQEVITLNKRKFLIIGIGINIISNPNFKSKYQTTNILKETDTKPKINELSDLIILSYENFFDGLNSYNYNNFKKKANLMALN